MKKKHKTLKSALVMMAVIAWGIVTMWLMFRVFIMGDA